MRPFARLLVSACAAALLLGAAPALAQVGTPALPVALAPIPTPRDAPYPGVIGIAVDATDIDRRRHQGASPQRRGDTAAAVLYGDVYRRSHGNQAVAHTVHRPDVEVPVEVPDKNGYRAASPHSNRQSGKR